MKYSFKLSPQKQAQLEDWRRSKVVAVTPVPPKPKPLPRPAAPMAMSGYAQRKIARSIIGGTTSRFSTPPVQVHQPLTFHALGRLNFSEITGDLSIKELMSADSYDLFSMMYGRASDAEDRRKTGQRSFDSSFVSII